LYAVQVSSLDDIKTNSQTDSNAAKTMALDHLGVIAARIRLSMLKFQKDAGSRKGLKPLDDVSALVSYRFWFWLTYAFPTGCVQH
jgi:cohesin loading factor subunit SCC2